jgi:hypothetical protein
MSTRAKYVPPDPRDMTGLPTNADENPHLHTSQRGPAPTKPSGHLPFTDAVFPRIVIQMEHLLANVAKQQSDIIKASSNDYIAIIPFGAGNRFFDSQPKASQHILEFLNGLDFGTLDSDGNARQALELITPDALDKGGEKGHTKEFVKPWAMFLANAATDIRNYLLWQQTFPISRDIVFHALPFDKNLMTWVITDLSGDSVKDDDEAKKEALGAIKEALWKDPSFCRMATKLLQVAGVYANSSVEYAVIATRSFSLMYIETGDKTNTHAPVWLLLGKPLTTDRDQHREYVGYVRKTKFFVKLHPLRTQRRWIDCVWCKADTHCGHSCLFPKVDEGWLGPTNEQLASRLQGYVNTSSSVSKAKDSAKTRAPQDKGNLKDNIKSNRFTQVGRKRRERS